MKRNQYNLTEMKTIRLKHIALQNFKGIKEMVVDFADRTTIEGRNASGKTSIFDAFTWCLFGKDSTGRSDTANRGFMVKTIDPQTGEAIPQLEHSVSVTLDVDGKETTFTRQLVEEWGTTRGNADVVFKGNTTHYFVDGVEVNATTGEGNYAGAVAAVLPENLFRQITNPAYFPNLPWKEQRELLLTMAGDVSLGDVAEGNDAYMQVWNNISGKNVDDYKKSLATRRKKIEEEMKLIPARISGIQMATPEAEDWQALQGELEARQKALAEVEAEIMDVSAAKRREYEAAQARQQQVYALQTRQGEVVQAAKEQAQREHYEANAKRTQAMAQVEAKRGELTLTENNHRTNRATAQAEIDRLTAEIDKEQQHRADLLRRWETRNAEQYHPQPSGGTFQCPLCAGLECNNPLLVQNQANTEAKAREAWNRQQEADLNNISAEGQRTNERIATITRQLEEARKHLGDIDEMAEKATRHIEEELTRLQRFVETTPEVQADVVVPTDIAEWVELQRQIDELQATAAPTETPTDTAALQQRKAEATAEVDALKQRLAVRKTIEDNNAKIEAERDRQLTLAAQKADIEGEEMIVEELVHRQSEEIERRVNSLFQLVQFRMFEKQVNGGEKPTCIATVGGVRYADLNSAMKTNAGLDIINTVCAFNEVTAPIFIDNAEGVNTLHPTAAQTIRLVVTTGDLSIIREV